MKVRPKPAGSRSAPCTGRKSLVHRTLVAIAVDQVQHAVADALDHRRVDGLRLRLMVDRVAAVAQHLVEHLAGRLPETDREAARARAVRLGEIGGERIRILVDQEVDAALAIHRDRPRLVAQRRGEAHLAEVVVQQLALPLRRGEFDELEAVDAHRVLERGDGHAEVGALGLGLRLCAHGGLRAATRLACMGRRSAHSMGRPPRRTRMEGVIVSDATNCKAWRNK